jgi:hypothetical protein
MSTAALSAPSPTTALIWINRVLRSRAFRRSPGPCRSGRSVRTAPSADASSRAHHQGLLSVVDLPGAKPPQEALIEQRIAGVGDGSRFRVDVGGRHEALHGGLLFDRSFKRLAFPFEAEQALRLGGVRDLPAQKPSK